MIAMLTVILSVWEKKRRKIKNPLRIFCFESICYWHCLLHHTHVRKSPFRKIGCFLLRKNVSCSFCYCLIKKARKKPKRIKGRMGTLISFFFSFSSKCVCLLKPVYFLVIIRNAKKKCLFSFTFTLNRKQAIHIYNTRVIDQHTNPSL